MSDYLRSRVVLTATRHDWSQDLCHRERRLGSTEAGAGFKAVSAGTLRDRSDESALGGTFCHPLRTQIGMALFKGVGVTMCAR